MNPENLGELIAQRKWILVAAIAIGLVVRLLKSDTRIPIDIPTRWRVWLALGLGIVAGVLERVGTGEGRWSTAIADGLVASLLAIVAQNTMIDSLRGGKEIVVPGLIKPGVSPAPNKPPSIPPAPLAALMVCMVLGIGGGCRDGQPITQPQVEAGTAVAGGICSLVEGVDDSGVVRSVCATVEEIGQIISFILTLRQTTDAGPPAASAPCTPLPQSTFCATKAETAKGVLFVTQVRSRRLMRDGGAVVQ